MTNEDAINMLYGIQADNLNLDDAYTKDKYDALTIAIKALEQKTGWIPVSERKAEFPCIATDEHGNYPFIPSAVVTINGCCYDGKNFNFNVEEFLKGEEVIWDGEKAYLPPRKIVAWMPLPAPYKESEV